MKKKIIKLIRPILSPFVNRIRLSDMIHLGATVDGYEVINGNPFLYVYVAKVLINDKEYPIIFKRTILRGHLMLGIDARQYDKADVQKKAYKEIQTFMAAGAMNAQSGLKALIRRRTKWSVILLAVMFLLAVLGITNIILYSCFLFYSTSTVILVGTISIVAFFLALATYSSLQ